MPRKKKQQTPEDHPSHWIMAAVGALVFGAIVPEFQPLAFLILAGSLLALPFSIAAHKKKAARTLALRDLQTLSHRDLEFHVARVIGALPGWKAEATRGGGDQGADVIATGPGGVKVAVQVKHYRNNVGNKAVQEIVASKAYYACSHAVVFTSGPGYTKAAHELAKANSVPLWTPEDLFALQDCAAKKEAPPRRLLPASA